MNNLVLIGTHNEIVYYCQHIILYTLRILKSDSYKTINLANLPRPINRNK